MGTDQRSAARQGEDIGVTAKDNRLFLEAVLWMAGRGRRGGICRRNWAIGTPLSRALPLDPVGYLGSCVPNGQCRPGLRRSHDRQHRDLRPPACRWRPQKRGPQALGRSCSGFGTQIHGLVDALGNPIGFTLTGAEQADISQAPALLDQAPSAGTVIADEGYDADAWVERLESQQVEAVIPPRSNRKSPRDYDRHRYKARNLVERFFNPLKQFRRIATRYEKPAAHFTAMVICGCIMLWLK